MQHSKENHTIQNVVKLLITITNFNKIDTLLPDLPRESLVNTVTRMNTWKKCATNFMAIHQSITLAHQLIILEHIHLEIHQIGSCI